MTSARSVAVVFLSATLFAASAQSARAQQAEVGVSLISASKVLDGGEAIVGVPSGSLGPFFAPGVYTSFFLGRRMALEPRLGFVWVSEDGESFHIVNVSGQFAYFLQGSGRSSPYLLVNGGFLEMSGEDYSPKSYGAGVGYRIPTDGRLVFRLEGGWTRVTTEFGPDNRDYVAFSLSIGGLFR